MSLLRESEGSTNIARPKPIRRISAAAQNSAQVRGRSKNGREFDPHAFLATIGEGRKAMLFPKKQTIFAQVSCLSWKWRKRSSVKIAERTYEERAQALHC